VTFQSDREGDVAIFEQHIGGTGLHRLTTPEPGTVHVPESWSPHGKHLSYSVVKDSEYSLWVLSVDDGKAARFGDVQSLEPLGSMFSPDGRWIVYHSLPRGSEPGSQSAGVFARAFPSDPVRQAPRVGRDSQPVWSGRATSCPMSRGAAHGWLQSVSKSRAS